MKTLLAPTEDFIKIERTILDASATAGSNVTLTVKNNDGITANSYIVIGTEGSEHAELQKVDSVSGDTSVTVPTLKFSHSDDEPVVVYRYNQRKFYGATSKDGTYNELTADGSPKAIQVDDPQGTRLEYTGSEGYTYFKATYYNADEALESSIADSEATLADESKRYCSINAIKEQAGLQSNIYITDGDIETFRRRAENEINSSIFTEYALPLEHIPDTIENIATLLAAGYIDWQEFGSEGEGKKWLGEARGILNDIKEGKRILMNEDFEQLEKSSGTVGRVSGLPDTLTEPSPLFTIDDEY